MDGRDCSICTGYIGEGDTFVSTGEGVAHYCCFFKDDPPKLKETFLGVLVNYDDQTLVRSLLEEFTLPVIQDEIVRRFNEEMMRRHDCRMKRCEREREEQRKLISDAIGDSWN